MSSGDAEQSNIPEGCDLCPNRKRDEVKTRGNYGALGFALFLALLCGLYSVERSPNGGIQAKEEPPTLVWAIFIPAIGLCLGVRIDAEVIGRFLGVRQ